MVSNQILQNTLENTAGLTGAGCAIYDGDGKLIAQYGDMREIGTGRIQGFLASGLKELQEDDFYYSRAQDEADTNYVLVTDSATPNSEMTQKLLEQQIGALIVAYRERLDKENFVKNLILDNLLQIDIYNKAKKLRIGFNKKRAVLIVESGGSDAMTSELIRQFTAQYENDFYTNVDETNVVIVHEIQDPENPQEELYRYASELQEKIAETGNEMRISLGTVMDDIKDVSKSYKEAKLALDVGKIFFEDKSIVPYNNLGVGRLIYQLPLNLCRMFIREIFGDKTPDQFDKETITTINKFFENSLNISETSRQLFIHRNTLVYRLDKIQKMTGLDLRSFDDAIIFKIALMVVKYMDYMKKIDY